MASIRMRVAFENSVVPASTASAVLGAPSAWMTASAPATAAATAAASSASPAILVSLRIVDGDAGRAAREGPHIVAAARAHFTVSRPMPWLAPITSRVAIALSAAPP